MVRPEKMSSNKNEASKVGKNSTKSINKKSLGGNHTKSRKEKSTGESESTNMDLEKKKFTIMEDYGPKWKNVLGKPIPHNIYTTVIHVLSSNISKVSDVSVVLSRRGRLQRIFKCESCDWTVELSRPKPYQSDGDWFLTKEPPLHKCNQPYEIKRVWDLLNNTTYLNLSKMDTKLTYADMIKLMEEKGLKVTLKKAAFSKAKAICQLVEKERQSDQYQDLHRFLNMLSNMNPELVVALQLDSNDRFYRLFLGFPITKYNGKITQNMNITDCYYSKNKSWDGVLHAWISKTGFGFPILQAIAFLPSESTEHLSWSVQMAWRSGLKLDNSVFSDRGPLLTTARCIDGVFGYKIPINFCLQHLTRNLNHHFNLTKKSLPIVRMYLQQIAETTSLNSFFYQMHMMIQELVKCNDHTFSTCINISMYILQLHPRSWTDFANLSTFIENDYRRLLFNFRTALLYVKKRKDQQTEHDDSTLNVEDNIYNILKDCIQESLIEMSKPETVPLRVNGTGRYNIYRTNLAEGMAHQFSSTGIRSAPIIEAVKLLCKQSNMERENLIQQYEMSKLNNVELTTIGLKLVSTYVFGVKTSSIESIDVTTGSGHTTIVSQMFRNEKSETYRTTICYKESAEESDKWTCSCQLHNHVIEMLGGTCKCIVDTYRDGVLEMVLPKMTIQKFIQMNIHPCYIPSNIIKYIEKGIPTIKIPSDYDITMFYPRFDVIDPSTNAVYKIDNVLVRPPPKYKANVESGKRIKSTGEFSNSPNTENLRKRKRKSKEGENYASFNTSLVKKEKPTKNFYKKMKSLSMDEWKKQSQRSHRCIFCRSEMHDLRNCPVIHDLSNDGNVQPKSLIPGMYIVYKPRLCTSLQESFASFDIDLNQIPVEITASPQIRSSWEDLQTTNTSLSVDEQYLPQFFSDLTKDRTESESDKHMSFSIIQFIVSFLSDEVRYLNPNRMYMVMDTPEVNKSIKNEFVKYQRTPLSMGCTQQYSCPKKDILELIAEWRNAEKYIALDINENNDIQRNYVLNFSRFNNMIFPMIAWGSPTHIITAEDFLHYTTHVVWTACYGQRFVCNQTTT